MYNFRKSYCSKSFRDTRRTIRMTSELWLLARGSEAMRCTLSERIVYHAIRLKPASDASHRYQQRIRSRASEHATSYYIRGHQTESAQHIGKERQMLTAPLGRRSGHGRKTFEYPQVSEMQAQKTDLDPKRTFDRMSEAKHQNMYRQKECKDQSAKREAANALRSCDQKVPDRIRTAFRRLSSDSRRSPCLRCSERPSR